MGLKYPSWPDLRLTQPCSRKYIHQLDVMMKTILYYSGSSWYVFLHGQMKVMCPLTVGCGVTWKNVRELVIKNAIYEENSEGPNLVKFMSGMRGLILQQASFPPIRHFSSHSKSLGNSKCHSPTGRTNSGLPRNNRTTKVQTKFTFGRIQRNLPVQTSSNGSTIRTDESIAPAHVE